MRMAPRQYVSFQGTEGVLRLNAPFNAGVFGEARLILEKGSETRVVRFPTENQYVLQVENFCESLRNGSEYPCSLEFSQGTQAMIDRVFERARG